MATPQPNNGPRGPERHTHDAEPAVDRPVISPVESWPTAPTAVPTPAASDPDAPQKIRVKKRRKRSAQKRARAAAKKTGRVIVSIVAVIALVAVVVLIVRGDLFGI